MMEWHIKENILMYYKAIFVIVIFLFSTDAKSNNRFECNDELNLDQLYSIKEMLRKSNFETTSFIGKSEIIQSTKSDAYSELYATCLSKQLSTIRINKLESSELHRLFNMLLHVNFYSPQDSLIGSIRDIISIKKNRGEYVDNFIISMHEVYIRSLYIEKARELAKEYTHISFSKTYPFTNNITAASSYIELDSKNKSLTRVPFTFPKGGFVIIVSSPSCSPSNRFVNWLVEHQKIKSRFISNSLFITPNDSTLYIDKLTRINKKMKPLKMVYRFSKDGWPSITLWDTPTLYFYYDGELKSQLIGWPRKGREEKLTDMLRKVDL